MMFLNFPYLSIFDFIIFGLFRLFEAYMYNLTFLVHAYMPKLAFRWFPILHLSFDSLKHVSL